MFNLISGSFESNEDNYADAFANILNLKLKKPKHWQWELSTSRSCTNIALPRILLFDHKGHLLADTNHQQENQIIRSQDIKNQNPKNTYKKAATCNLMTDICKVLDEEFGDLCIAENVLESSSLTSRSPVHSLTPTSIDFKYPNPVEKSRSNSFKEVRFNVNGVPQNYSRHNPSDLSTAQFTSTNSSSTTRTSTSSNSNVPREKRRHRRAAGKSDSILERFSLSKGRFSSPEYAVEQDVCHAPLYYLVSSKAGTLVVQKESFSRYRRRTKPRHSSSENMHNKDLLGSQQLRPEETVQRKKSRARRYNSARSLLLPRLSYSSEDDYIVNNEMKSPKVKRHQGKMDLVTIDPDNDVLSAQERPTAR